MMADETWMTAAEAKEYGLIDVVDKAVKLAASLDVEGFQNVPKDLLPQPPASDPPQQSAMEDNPEPSGSALAIVQLCNQAGYPEQAELMLKTNASVEEVRQRLGDCDTIKNLCAAARSDKAEEYIRSGKSVEAVRTELFEILAAQQQPINNSLPPQQQQTPSEHSQSKTVRLDVQALYQKRNHNNH